MSNLPELRNMLKADSVKQQFNDMLKDNAPAFLSSLITTVNNNKSLQAANPKDLVLVAATAASLNLSVNPNLGYASVIPYRNGRTGVTSVSLQIMVNGWVALAKRGGQIKKLICEPVYEGELLRRDRFNEDYDFLDTGCTDESKIIGCMCKLEEIGGFKKTEYWDKERIMAHGKRYSKSWSRPDSLWHKNFTAMARKTLLKYVLTKYATLSFDLQTAIERDERQLEGSIDDVHVSQEVEDGSAEDVTGDSEGGENTPEDKEEFKEAGETKEKTEILDKDGKPLGGF